MWRDSSHLKSLPGNGRSVFEEKDSLLENTLRYLSDDHSATLLVKGSRSSRMDLLVEKLEQSDLLEGDAC